MIEQFCDWLSVTKLSLAFQSAEWFVPLVQTVHIVCIAALLIPVLQVGTVLIRRRTLADLSTVISESAKRIWPLLIVLLITGALLTITEPARELLNWVFRTKMVLVALLATIIYCLAARVRSKSIVTPPSRRIRVGTGVALILLAVAIITAGRWIAYT